MGCNILLMPKCVRVLPRIFVATLVILAWGGGRSPSEKLAQVRQEFVYGVLAASPSSATAAGLHLYEGVRLDELLDDVSAGAIEKQRKFYEKTRDKLADIKVDQLNPEEK